MARTGTSTRRERFLPYRYSRSGLSLRLTSCVLDNVRPIEEFGMSRRQLDLSSIQFSEVTFGLEVEVTQDLIDEVFPESEINRPMARLVVALRCDDTRLRRRISLVQGPLDAGPYRAEVSVAHGEIFGVMQLVPFLLRHETAGNPTAGYAAFAGVRLASGRLWEIRTDTKRLGEGTYLDIRYVSFRKQGPSQFPWPENLYQLDCDRDNPTLWLNSDHEEIAGVLNSRAAVGTRARMREVFFDYVTTAVWTRLFMKAAMDVLTKDETVFEWEDNVLATLLPALYPNQPSPEARVAELQQDFVDGDLQIIMERLDAALQERNEVCRHMLKLVETSA